MLCQWIAKRITWNVRQPQSACEQGMTRGTTPNHDRQQSGHSSTSHVCTAYEVMHVVPVCTVCVAMHVVQ
eukprot:scaffold145991_cov21-Tisochrysis_lutea.AAC.1